MREGKFGVYSDHALVPLPDSSSFGIIYKFTGDGKEYIKTADGVSSLLAGAGLTVESNGSNIGTELVDFPVLLTSGNTPKKISFFAVANSSSLILSNSVISVAQDTVLKTSGSTDGGGVQTITSEQGQASAIATGVISASKLAFATAFRVFISSITKDGFILNIDKGTAVAFEPFALYWIVES